MIVVDTVFVRFLLHLAPFPVHQQRQVLHQSPKLVHHRRQYSHQQMPPFQMVRVVVVKDIVHQIQQQPNTGGLSGQGQRTVVNVSGKYINDFAQLIQPQFCPHVVHQIGLEKDKRRQREDRERQRKAEKDRERQRKTATKEEERDISTCNGVPATSTQQCLLSCLVVCSAFVLPPCCRPRDATRLGLGAHGQSRPPPGATCRRVGRNPTENPWLKYAEWPPTILFGWTHCRWGNVSTT